MEPGALKSRAKLRNHVQMDRSPKHTRHYRMSIYHLILLENEADPARLVSRLPTRVTRPTFSELYKRQILDTLSGPPVGMPRSKTISPIELPKLLLSSKNSGGLHVPSAYRVQNITKGSPVYIRGGTLERFFLPPENFQVSVPPGCQTFLVYPPSPRQLLFPCCDGCPTQHRQTNLACSRSLNKSTRFVDSKLLYSFANRDAAGIRFTLVSTYQPPGAKVSNVIVKIAQ